MIVKLDEIGKKYGKREVLSDISVSMEAGKIYGLIGKNGAGKSTMMKIICGIIKQDSGTYEHSYKKIGALIEDTAAYGHLNARENLEIYLSYSYEISEKERNNRIASVLKKVNLTDEKKHFKMYSVGMKKRLGIAMALVNEPDLLILDEPTAGLDITGIEEVRLILREYMKNKENTVLLSSHDTRDLCELCDELIFIDQGKIINIVREFDRNPLGLEELYLSLVKEVKK